MGKSFKIFLGSAVGIINGLFGSGGGVIAVCALEKKSKIKERKSHATSVAIILPVSVVSAAIYFFKAEIDFINVLKASAGGIAGGILGAFILSRISNNIIRRVFGAVMIASSIRMLII